MPTSSKEHRESNKIALTPTDGLLILLLLKLGATQDELAWALGVSQTTISRQLSGLQIAKGRINIQRDGAEQ